METLVSRNSNEEVRKLERANQRLEEQTRGLQEELRVLRGHRRDARPSTAPTGRMDADCIQACTRPATDDDDDAALAERLERVRMGLDEHPPPPPRCFDQSVANPAACWAGQGKGGTSQERRRSHRRGCSREQNDGQARLLHRSPSGPYYE